MKEIVEKLTDALGSFLPDIDISIKLGVIGGIIILLLFFIALAMSAGCKITRYRKKLMQGAKMLNAQPPVTEENVDVVYKELETHPEEVKKGWEAFMDQRVGYPSDYITTKDVLSRREFSGKGAAAKVFLIILGAIVCALVAIVGFFNEVEAGTVMQAVMALEFLIIPVAVYIITVLLLDIAYNRKIRRLGLTFESFCEILDAKVVVSDKDERDFVSDNLEEINRRVEELIAGRTGGEDVIEVIAAPRVEQTEEVEPVAEEVAEPVVEEEPVAAEPEEEPEPVVKYADMTEQEKEDYFLALLDVVDRAVADETLTDDDYALIAATIYENAMQTGAMENPDEAAIFDECFSRLAAQLKG